MEKANWYCWRVEDDDGEYGIIYDFKLMIQTVEESDFYWQCGICLSIFSGNPHYEWNGASDSEELEPFCANCHRFWENME